MEFDFAEYAEIDEYCKRRNILWFASCWDVPSVEFMNQFDPPMHKAPSAMLTNYELLRSMKSAGKPLILSTGMSTMAEIESAVNLIGEKRLLLAHTTSSYPCALDELRRLVPIQNSGTSAQKIAEITKNHLDERYPDFQVCHQAFYPSCKEKEYV